MRDPRVTGISVITGKVVTIRHATGTDREIAAQKLARRSVARSELAKADIVVAAEGDKRIGFAVLDPPDEGGTACLHLVVSRKRRSMSGPLLEHLLAWSGVRSVRAEPGTVRCLDRAGFRRVRSEALRQVPTCPKRGREQPQGWIFERT